MEAVEGTNEIEEGECSAGEEAKQAEKPRTWQRPQSCKRPARPYARESDSDFISLERSVKRQRVDSPAALSIQLSGNESSHLERPSEYRKDDVASESENRPEDERSTCELPELAVSLTARHLSTSTVENLVQDIQTLVQNATKCDSESDARRRAAYTAVTITPISVEEGVYTLSRTEEEDQDASLPESSSALLERGCENADTLRPLCENAPLYASVQETPLQVAAESRRNTAGSAPESIDVSLAHSLWRPVGDDELLKPLTPHYQEGSKLASNDPNRRACFNCGEIGHMVKDCQQPQNTERIQAAARSQRSSMTMFEQKRERYYNALSERVGHVEVGKYSPQLRKALDMREGDPPPFLWRMVCEGAPPAYALPSDASASGEDARADETTDTDPPTLIPGVSAPFPEDADVQAWQEHVDYGRWQRERALIRREPPAEASPFPRPVFAERFRDSDTQSWHYTTSHSSSTSHDYGHHGSLAHYYAYPSAESPHTGNHSAWSPHSYSTPPPAHWHFRRNPYSV